MPINPEYLKLFVNATEKAAYGRINLLEKMIKLELIKLQ